MGFTSSSLKISLLFFGMSLASGMSAHAKSVYKCTYQAPKAVNNLAAYVVPNGDLSADHIILSNYSAPRGSRLVAQFRRDLEELAFEDPVIRMIVEHAKEHKDYDTSQTVLGIRSNMIGSFRLSLTMPITTANFRLVFGENQLPTPPLLVVMNCALWMAQAPDSPDALLGLVANE